MEIQKSFVPAGGHDLFLPFYDSFTRLVGAGRARSLLIDQATLGPHQRVLEVGCGTGSLVVQIRRNYPDVEVVGLDPDRKALARARRKAERAELSIHFDQGYADKLAYEAGSFDRVFSCLMFHHLEHDDKEKMLLEIVRVLKPGGRLELVDLVQSKPSEVGPLARLLHSHHLLKDNSEDRVLALLTQAGLGGAKNVRRGRLLVGSIAYYQASAPIRGRGAA